MREVKVKLSCHGHAGSFDQVRKVGPDAREISDCPFSALSQLLTSQSTRLRNFTCFVNIAPHIDARNLLPLQIFTMASTERDALLLLRQSIASESSIIPTTSADPSSPSESSLSQATHLHFADPTLVSIPIDSPTRFISSDRPVDLRSIYFAWLNREVAIPEYNASATKLNDELAGTATVHKFAFVERLDLITWLEGASEESEYIRPLAEEKDVGQGAVAASAVKGASAPVSSSARAGRGTLDPRLAQIYNGERRMGDRNTALRGIKPTVWRCRLPWLCSPLV